MPPLTPGNNCKGNQLFRIADASGAVLSGGSDGTHYGYGYYYYQYESSWNCAQITLTVPSTYTDCTTFTLRQVRASLQFTRQVWVGQTK